MISVIVPVYNEAPNIPDLAARILGVMRAERYEFEVLFVDDGSTDGSGDLLDQAASREGGVRVIHFDRNYGQSAAFFAGFEHARGDMLVSLDADLQNDPAEIPVLLDALEGCDLAYGVRRERHDPFLKRAASWVANTVRNWVTREDVEDTACSLKAFRRPCAEAIIRLRGMHRFFPTLARLAGFRAKPVFVKHYPRAAGKTKYTIRNRLVGPFLDLLGVRWMQARRLDYRIARETPAHLPAGRKP